MPVEDLIRYFNAADRAGDSLLYPKGGRVEAWHRGLRLGSRFQPVVDLRRKSVVGHRASLHVEREDGTSLDAETAYAVCETEQSVIHLDRLCRTLHALNFLAQRRGTGGWLQMAVHPRHLLAVPNQHGLVYEAILKRCGLAPEDIVLELDAGNIDRHGRFAHALANYRQRGYRMALDLTDEANLPAAIELRPDLLRLTRGHLASAAKAGEVGIVRQAAHIDDGDGLRTSQDCGIELAMGELFGAPAIDCHPTHKVSINSYNPASSLGVHHENRQ